MLIFILVQDFCPLKTEIARFPIGSRLKFFLDILLGVYFYVSSETGKRKFSAYFGLKLSKDSND